MHHEIQNRLKEDAFYIYIYIKKGQLRVVDSLHTNCCFLRLLFQENFLVLTMPSVPTPHAGEKLNLFPEGRS